MSAIRRFQPQIEQLDERALPAVSFGVRPSFAALLSPPASQAPPVHHTTALTGQVSGTWALAPGIPDVGARRSLSGTGTVAPLGAVQAGGAIRTTGFLLEGHATGTITLTGAAGSVTLRLVGPPQPGFSPPPNTFAYQVVGGTGAYAHLQDQGTLQFTWLTGTGSSAGRGMFTFTFSHPQGTSGIEGVAMIGPISPVDRVGVPNSRPLAGAVISVRTDDGTEVARVVADEAGRFRVSL